MKLIVTFFIIGMSLLTSNEAQAGKSQNCWIAFGDGHRQAIVPSKNIGKGHTNTQCRKKSRAFAKSISRSQVKGECKRLNIDSGGKIMTQGAYKTTNKKAGTFNLVKDHKKFLITCP